MVGECNYSEVVAYLLNAINQGRSAGAEFAAIGANTPHIVFDELKKVSPIPLISIIESTAKHAAKNDIKKIALLGTKFTMKEDFFKNVLLDYKVTPVLPTEEEQEYIHMKIMDELEVGIINPDTKVDFLKIVDRMIREEEIDGLILGCTELPLLMSQEDDKRIAFLNTIDIHVSDIVDYMNEK